MSGEMSISSSQNPIDSGLYNHSTGKHEKPSGNIIRRLTFTRPFNPLSIIDCSSGSRILFTVTVCSVVFSGLYSDSFNRLDTDLDNLKRIQILNRLALQQSQIYRFDFEPAYSLLYTICCKLGDILRMDKHRWLLTFGYSGPANHT